MPVATGAAFHDDVAHLLDVFEPGKQLAQQSAARGLLAGVGRAGGEQD
ncbi:hypothetical protein [Amycolatopsis sulphurea]|nr:hypothetical protein [Amycolatopsis sulphurea]